MSGLEGGKAIQQVRGVGSHRHSGEPGPLDAGWEAGLGHQVRSRKRVCWGKEEGWGDWSHPTYSAQRYLLWKQVPCPGISSTVDTGHGNSPLTTLVNQSLGQLLR